MINLLKCLKWREKYLRILTDYYPFNLLIGYYLLNSNEQHTLLATVFFLFYLLILVL